MCNYIENLELWYDAELELRHLLHLLSTLSLVATGWNPLGPDRFGQQYCTLHIHV